MAGCVCVQRLLLAIAAATLAPTSQSQQGPPRVTVTVNGLGSAVGRRLSSAGVDAFLGLRFAEPPQRFEPAELVRSWGPDLVDAVAFGPACSQTFGDRDGWHPNRSEDCLTLNLWRPAEAERAGRFPVMVWLYGGAFNHGGSDDPEYDGANLAGRGVIVITLNYRVGALGFLPIKGGVGEGTGTLNGIHDQIVALRWVTQYVSAFGGDPSAVTVFGNSAGAESACVLLVSPLARSLFHRLILQSGPCTGDSSYMAIRDSSTIHSYAAVSRTDLDQGMSADDLLDAYPLAFPRVDGWVLPDTPDALILAGQVNVKDVIIGGNNFDGIATWSILPDGYSSWLELMLVMMAAEGYTFAGAMAVAAQYDPSARFRRYYPGAWAQADADIAVICPSKRLASELVELGASVRFYYFSFGPFCNDIAQMPPSYTGDPYTSCRTPWTEHWASHTAEIQFVFGSAARWPPHGTRAGASICDPLSGQHASEGSVRLSEAMMDYWSSFAKTGEPRAEGQPTWPPYKTRSSHTALREEDEKVLILDSNISIGTGVKSVDCQQLAAAKAETGYRLLAVGLLVLSIGGGILVRAVHTGFLRDPRGSCNCAKSEAETIVGASAATEQTEELIKGQRCARLSLNAVGGTGVLLACIPLVAPLGCVPAVLALFGGSVILRRPLSYRRTLCAAVSMLTCGVYASQMLLAFSAAAYYTTYHAPLGWVLSVLGLCCTVWTGASLCYLSYVLRMAAPAVVAELAEPRRECKSVAETAEIRIPLEPIASIYSEAS